MYGWIWRRLPGGLGQKVLWAAGLIAVAVAALWFWAFPALERRLHFDRGTVEQQGSPSPSPASPARGQGRGPGGPTVTAAAPAGDPDPVAGPAAAGANATE